jgi:hypothetical protein
MNDMTEDATPRDALLIHIEPAYQHAGHALLWCAPGAAPAAAQRAHSRGGNALTRAALDAGHDVHLVAAWHGLAKWQVDHLYLTHPRKKLCPICARGGVAFLEAWGSSWSDWERLVLERYKAAVEGRSDLVTA